MDEPERENLGRIAMGKSISRQYEFVNEDLERRGYLMETPSGPAVCSSSFKNFLLRETAGSRGGKRFFGLFGRKSRP
jgi:hypothetical protein